MHQFMFCVCPDVLLTQDHIKQRVPQEIFKKKQVFWGDEDLGKNFWEALTLQSLFSEQTTIIIRNAHTLPAETWKKISSTIPIKNPSTYVVLCLEGLWEKNKPKIPAHITKLPCFTFAQKHKLIWQQQGLTEANLKAFVQDKAMQLGITFEKQALAQFILHLPLHASAILGELTKIALYTDGKPITENDLIFGQHTKNFNIFSFIQHIKNNNSKQIWEILLYEHAKGEEPLFYILAMLQRELKKLWGVCLQNDSKNIVNKQIPQTTNTHDLAKIWDSIHTAEFSVKSGDKSPQQALEKLITDLSFIF